jgi:hypothetical protein
VGEAHLLAVDWLGWICYLLDKLEVIALLLLYLSQNTFYYKCYCYKGSYKGIVV